MCFRWAEFNCRYVSCPSAFASFAAFLRICWENIRKYYSYCTSCIIKHAYPKFAVCRVVFFSKVVIRCACPGWCHRATWLRGRYCLISHRKAVHQYGVEHPCNRKQCAWKTQRSMAKLMTIVDMCNFPTVYLLAVKAQQVALTLVSLVSKIS